MNSAVSAEQALSVRWMTTVLLYILQTGYEQCSVRGAGTLGTSNDNSSTLHTTDRLWTVQCPRSRHSRYVEWQQFCFTYYRQARNSAVSVEQALSVRRTTTVLLYVLQTGYETDVSTPSSTDSELKRNEVTHCLIHRKWLLIYTLVWLKSPDTSELTKLTPVRYDLCRLLNNFAKCILADFLIKKLRKNETILDWTINSF